MMPIDKSCGCDRQKDFNTRRLMRQALLMVAGYFLLGAPAVQSAVLNEWTFESDVSGLTLSQAVNVGSEGLVFDAGGVGFLETDGLGGLLCTHDDAGSSTGMWTNGAILNSMFPVSVTAGVQYLRYDFQYDSSDTDDLNNSGSVVGFAFYDGAGSKVAGVALQYDVDAGVSPGYSVIKMTELTNTVGTVTVIARVDLTSHSMAVWYNLTGDASAFSEASPDATAAVSLTSLNALRFQATGDIRPAGSTDFVNIENLRTADSWAEITEIIPDFSAGPAVEIFSVTVDNPSGTAGTDIGETNTVTVVLRNPGAPVTNVITSVSAVLHPEFFTITSLTAPSPLVYPQQLTNTFTLVAKTNTLNGLYTFNVEAVPDGGAGTNTTFTLVVGSFIDYLTNDISEVSGGVISGRYEPGETIDIAILSTNSGAQTVSNIVNSLSANPAYFTISNLSSRTYSSMPVGAATSTLYRVTIASAATNGTYWFNVTNRAGSKVWTNSFPLEIFNQSLPSLSTGSLIFQVSEGYVEQAQVVISNGGNAELNFTVSDNALWDSAFSVNTSAVLSVNEAKKAAGTIPLNDPYPANPLINGSDSGESDTIDIGFPFPFYGTSYSKLYIDSNGAIILSTSNRTGNISLADPSTGDLPRGNRPLIAPFRNIQLQISTNNPVRYVLKTSPTRLVIVHTNVTLSAYPTDGTNLQFQTELFADGRIKFSYFNINGSGLSNVVLGIQGDSSHYLNIDMTPASGKAVEIDPFADRWVNYSPTGGTVAALGSTVVTFTADATTRLAGASNAFNSVFSWSGGGSDGVSVSASVIAAVPLLTNDSAVLFFGNAGEVVSTPLVLSNAGNAALNFIIIETNTLATAYQGEVSSNAVWTDISSTGIPLNMLNPHENPYINATNEGFSALQPIGFAFPFYGELYTQFSAGVNGGISLGSTNRMSAGNDFGTSREDVPLRFIAPYWGNLYLDTNAVILFKSTTNELVVSWQNMEQQGVVYGSNLTFQAVLYASGRIEFRYKQVNGYNWPLTKWGIRSGAAQATSGLLILPGDAITTNIPYGYSQTSYVASVAGRSVFLTSSNYPVITYTPSQGLLAAGESAVITVSGSAAGLTPGGGSSITNTADLKIIYERGTNLVGVVFVVTNSVETVMASLMDEDGDGLSYDEELIAGTDPMNASSVFAVSTASGKRLSWNYAEGRTYTVWYALNLKDAFIPLDGASGLTTNVFTDAVHADVPVIYYRVTVD